MIDIIKGIIIGIANVIPGLSGGTIAVAMGIYDKLIHAINNISKDFKGSVKSVWKYAVGMAIGVVVSVLIIVKLFELLPLPTTMLFVGLILGSLPIILQNIKGQKTNIIDIILFIAMISLIIVMPLLGQGVSKELTLTIGGMAMSFIIGIIAAATMVIPGVSGSMMLMIMGYYNSLITLISDTIKAFLKFDIATCITGGLKLIPFAIGVLGGIILISKLIEYLLKKCRKTVFWAILGLLLASPYGIIVKMEGDIKINALNIILSIVAFVAGVFITLNLGEKEEKEEKHEINKITKERKEDEKEEKEEAKKAKNKKAKKTNK